MTPSGRRAWRKAAKKLRCKMGRRWRSQEEWVHGKRWAELVPDLEAHRAHITGSWFKRHGFQSFDPESSSRHYIGLRGTANGDTIGFVEAARPFTARSIFGMTMGARKRRIQEDLHALSRELIRATETFDINAELTNRGSRIRSKYRIGERLRPCPGCFDCAVECWVCHEPHEPLDELCGGSGVIRAGKLNPDRRRPDCVFYVA